MNTKIVKTNYDGFVKDTSSGAIINKNYGELAKVKAEMDSAKRINQIIQENEVIKADLADIKAILVQMLESQKK